jgi:hypothetical protein
MRQCFDIIIDECSGHKHKIGYKSESTVQSRSIDSSTEKIIKKEDNLETVLKKHEEKTIAVNQLAGFLYFKYLLHQQEFF